MGKTKSERHHWWPECVSKHWSDEGGGVHWLKTDDTTQRARPASFGVIGNGHYIKLGKEPGETTPWDQNFESFFQQADDGFPDTIAWLEGLPFENRIGRLVRERFIPQPSTDEQFAKLVEAITSLAIRSPRTRESAVSLAEHFRGSLPERERNSLITMNIRDMHANAVKAFGVRGKATAIHSPDREFIFGDGFYHDLTSPSGPPHSPRILVPLTPRLAVLYAIPSRYTTEPRLSTIVIADEEAERLNNVVQTYSREWLFYRTDRPELIDDYRAGKHLRYTSPGNIVENMVHAMPGVPDRDTSLDFLSELGRNRSAKN